MYSPWVGIGSSTLEVEYVWAEGAGCSTEEPYNIKTYILYIKSLN